MKFCLVGCWLLSLTRSSCTKKYAHSHTIFGLEQVAIGEIMKKMPTTYRLVFKNNFQCGRLCCSGFAVDCVAVECALVDCVQ